MVKNKEILQLVTNQFLQHCLKELNIADLPNVIYISDQDNSKDFFGKTAYFMPENKQIVVYITGRHPKDILRSVAHEMIHFEQSARGLLGGDRDFTVGYAQKDMYLRNIEKEAYTRGNLLLRDYEDRLRKGGERFMIESKNIKKVKEEVMKKIEKLLLGETDKKRKNLSSKEKDFLSTASKVGKAVRKDAAKDAKPKKSKNLSSKEKDFLSTVSKAGKAVRKDAAKDHDSMDEDENIEENLEEQDEDENLDESLEEGAKIVTPEQEEIFHKSIFSNRLERLNAKLMSKFIK